MLGTTWPSLRTTGGTGEAVGESETEINTYTLIYYVQNTLILLADVITIDVIAIDIMYKIEN